MTNIFLSVLAGSISIGLITVVLLAGTPFLNKRYAAKWKYWIWLFLAVRLLLPFSGTQVRIALQALQQEKTQQTVQAQQNNTPIPPRAPARVTVRLPAQMTAPITVPSKGSSIQTTLLNATMLLWAAGGICFIGFHLISYMRYKRQLLKTGVVIKDSRILCQLMQLKQELAIRRSVLPIEAADAASPMMLGFFHAVLVLPSTEYSAEELYFILKHELVHLKRGDVNMKLLLTTANAVHWFNPLIWLMRKEATVDMELSCDERVTQGADLAQRKAYTETLFSTLHRQCTKRTVLSTQFYGGKKVMKKRFQNILRKNAKKNGAAILSLVILFTIGTGTLIGCSVADKTASETQNRTDAPEKSPIDTLVETVPTDSNRSVMHDIELPDIVLEEAQAWTVEEYEYAVRERPGNHYTDWRIESLAHCYTYEDFQGMVLQVYRMNIEFLSEQPEDVFLVGGMTITEDGWVVPNYANSRYLIFRQDGEGLTLLTRMFENDCEAGDETFTHDLERRLAQGQPETPTMTFSQEGEINEVPAVMVEGDGYTLYLPDGDWYSSDFENWEDVDEEWKARIYDAWTAWNNENVRFWIARLEGKSLDEAQKELSDEGYAVVDDRMLRQDGDTIYCVELKKAETDTWCICSRYPVDAQEGYGMQIHAIAETFAVSG